MKHFLFLIILTASFSLYSQSEPDWISKFPYSSDYYTGIGSSNTGNRSDDYNLALERARLNLAAEISTSVTAETVLETRDSSSGDYEETFTEKMNQVVEQHLKELEIVDTWYSRSQGYWVYLRLSKVKWSEIREEESSELLSRVQRIINSAYFSASATTTDKLNRLGTAASLLSESPYGDVISGELASMYNGNIRDFIISEIYSVSSGISLELKPSVTSADSEGSVHLTASCHSQENYTGRLPLKLTTTDMDLKSLLTDVRGSSSFTLDKKQFPQSINRIKLQIDPEKLGFPVSGEYISQFVLDTAEARVEISSASLFLSIESNRTMNSVNIQISELFSNGDADFDLIESQEDSPYTLIFSMVFTDFPRVLENAPLIAGLQGYMSLKKEERVLYEYSTPAFKDGGLSYQQAYDRVFKKMIAHLKAEREYLRIIGTKINQ